MYTNDIVLDLVLASNDNAYQTNFANGTKITINNTIKRHADLECGGKLIDGEMSTTPNSHHDRRKRTLSLVCDHRALGNSDKRNAWLKT